MTRLLGIDLGLRRIGLAVADVPAAAVPGGGPGVAGGRVVPLSTLRRTTPERDGQTIARIAAEQRADEIIVGLPLSLDGSVGPQARETQAWAEAALGGCDLAYSFRDERLTTERALSRIGGPGRGRSGGPPSARALRAHRAQLDREAAALILQAELDERTGVVGPR